MALINCPECGHQVSSYAEACPECGCPVSEATAAAAQSAAQEAPVVASVPTAGAKAPIDPGHTPVTPDAGSIVVEFPGPNPMWTAIRAYQLQGGSKVLDVPWGKAVRLSANQPVTLKVFDPDGPKKMRILGTVFGFVIWIFVGALSGNFLLGFVLGAAIFALYFVPAPVCGNVCTFLAMPGKRYKAYWNKVLGGYQFRVSEVAE